MNDRLHLDCSAVAAKQAREWLAQRLDGWSAGRLDDALLVVSELVTNAVLHARTEVEVVAHVGAGAARVEVIDGSPARPMVRHYGADASTGRGLHLLDAMTARWGTEVSVHGKSVWFEIHRVPETGAPVASGLPPPDLSDWPDLSERSDRPDLDDGDEPAPSAQVAVPTVVVRILALPLAVYLAAEEHNDALMREFVLLAQAAPSAVPGRLVELAAEVRRQFGPATTAMRASIEAALERGDRTVDLAVTVPVAAPEFLLRLAGLLDEADEYCEAGDLLTLASPPEVRRFRAWYVGQIRDQIAGVAAQPWP